MNILAGIPSKLRNTSGKIADVLAPYCDRVIVVSQGAKVTSASANIEVIEEELNIGLKRARNIIMEKALDYEYMIQSDDDISIGEEVIPSMIKIMQDNPLLAVVSSCPRVYMKWDEGIEPNKDFVLTTHPSQLYLMRTSIIKKLGFFALETMEDGEYGLRMWKSGYPCGRVYAARYKDKKFVHNPFIFRNSKGDDSGGQTESEMKSFIPGSIAYIVNNYPYFIKSFDAANTENRTYRVRYNWDKLIKFCQIKYNGTLGYEDARGRRI